MNLKNKTIKTARKQILTKAVKNESPYKENLDNAFVNEFREKDV